MKVGDYVLVGGDWAGRITQLAFHPRVHLIWRLDNTSSMALLRHESVLTPLDPAVADILTAVNTNER
jgi:hypothetical protein